MQFAETHISRGATSATESQGKSHLLVHQAVTARQLGIGAVQGKGKVQSPLKVVRPDSRGALRRGVHSYQHLFQPALHLQKLRVARRFSRDSLHISNSSISRHFENFPPASWVVQPVPLQALCLRRQRRQPPSPRNGKAPMRLSSVPGSSWRKTMMELARSCSKVWRRQSFRGC